MTIDAWILWEGDVIHRLMHVFGYLVPKWWPYLGEVIESLGGRGFAGGSTSLGMNFESL